MKLVGLLLCGCLLHFPVTGVVSWPNKEGASKGKKSSNPKVRKSFFKSHEFSNIVANITQSKEHRMASCRVSEIHSFYDPTSNSCTSCSTLCGLEGTRKLCLELCLNYLLEKRQNSTIFGLQQENKSLRVAFVEVKKHNYILSAALIVFMISFGVAFALQCVYNKRNFQPKNPSNCHPDADGVEKNAENMRNDAIPQQTTENSSLMLPANESSRIDRIFIEDDNGSESAYGSGPISR